MTVVGRTFMRALPALTTLAARLRSPRPAHVGASLLDRADAIGRPTFRKRDATFPRCNASGFRVQWLCAGSV